MKTHRIALLSLAISFSFSTFSHADEMIRNGNFNNGIDGWWAAGGSIDTSSDEAVLRSSIRELTLGASY